MVRTQLRNLAKVLLIVSVVASSAGASEIDHYPAFMPNIRDYFLPAPGHYFLLYMPHYYSNTYRDGSGAKVSSIDVGGTAIDIAVDVNVFAMSPTYVWVIPKKVLGADFGGYVTLTIATSSVAAALSTDTNLNLLVDDTQFAFGDLFVQPVEFTWKLSHFDFSEGYGIYFPFGKYNVRTANNIGLGFFTHQFQTAVAAYPWSHRGTAITTALTYELNQNMEGLDLTPGQHMTLNWGISQYVPLDGKDLLLEVGPTGYSSWQISDDTGADANNPNLHDQVHAAGLQLGVTYVPWKAFINFKYLQEFGARDRFEGFSVGLSGGFNFGSCAPPKEPVPPKDPVPPNDPVPAKDPG